ncbi:TonB-dependent siderophore receptor [Nitrobacter winogradskyi]|uniref:TonB-dependent receptor n=2 Tax=Nitrobacter winogradskyi TaxID=913 RepID=A0A4Y3WDV0_NITWI|nr:TonB-dependent siderophore receptor [Nitrobacter winogradskyi]MCP1997904.1 outer membrane receptor for ferric coprogen and ferric-rhodotorulic acid [Nitrobacter winogradskyi]GEC17192.1 TonB-dependent receptor [Nitrobacter winogradskyi]
MADPVAAQANARSFNIAPQPLASALREFANQSGMQLAYRTSELRGMNSPGFQGSASSTQALARLLAGTGVSYNVSGANTVTIQRAAEPVAGAAPAGAISLSTIDVQGSPTSDPAATEGSGSYTTTQMSSSTGLPLSIRETPQSVTVISRQRMDDQNIRTFNDAMESTAGVTSQRWDNDRVEFMSRGFKLTEFRYDGVPVDADGAGDHGLSTVDMAIYDRVEVTKGASGLLQGAGNPGAAVNLARKRPTKAFQGSIAGLVGSWNNYRTDFDLSGALNDAGTVRGRFAGALLDGNSYLDHYHKRRHVLYGVIEVDLTDDTMLTIGSDYQKDKSRGAQWGGLPLFFSDGTRTNWDVSTNPGAVWSRNDFSMNTYFATLEHNFDNGWKAVGSFNHRRSISDFMLGSASAGYPDPVTGAGVSQFIWKGPFNMIQNTVNLNVSGPVEVMGRTHELTFGVLATRRSERGLYYDDPSFPFLGDPPTYDPSVPNFFTWRGNSPQPSFPLLGRVESSYSRTGTFVATRLKPIEHLSILLGGRLDWWSFNDKGTYIDPLGEWLYPAQYSVNARVTPYAGIVYDLTDVYSLYGSYTNIFAPDGFRDINRNFLPPTEGDSYEAGVKAAYFGGALNLTAAVFMIQQKNFHQFAGFDPVTNNNYYRSIDGVTSKGFELELAGQLAPGLQVYAGYTHTHARTSDGALVYSFIQTTAPQNLVKLFTTYRLPDQWDRWTIGGGVRWQDTIHGYVNSNPFGVRQELAQGGVFLLDLMARFRLTDQIDITFNATNLLNQKYYSVFGNYDTGVYGEPQRFTVSTKFQF